MTDFDSMSDEELDQYLLKNSPASKQPSAIDFDSLTDEQLDRYLAGKPIDAPERNELIGMGSSMAGALGGAAVGSAILPGLGTVAGGVIGGALGAFGGELAEDVMSEEELNYANAAKEAAVSLGVDALTMGTAKFAKPIYFAGKRALGFAGEEVGKDIAEKVASKATQKAGTPLSLKSTAELLGERGAVLTPIQLGEKGILGFYDNLGRGGILSGKMFDDNMVKVNEAVSGAVNDLVAKNDAGVMMKGELGAAVDSLFHEAKQGLSKQYELGLNEVQRMLKNDKVNVIPIHNAIDGFVKSYSQKIGKSALQDGTLSLLKQIKGDLSDGFKVVDVVKEVRKPYRNALGQTMYKTVKEVTGTKKVPVAIPAEELITWQKKVNKIITEMGNPQSSMYNSSIDADLAKVSNTLGKSIDKSMLGLNAEAYGKYEGIKKQYKKGIKTLRPDNIKSIINSAAKEDYERLGKVFVQEGVVNLDQFKKTWNALNFSVKSMKPEKLQQLGFASKDELFKTIKSTYMQNLLPAVNDVSFDIGKYAAKMSKMTKEELSQAKTVMGKDFGRFNQIRNAIIDASVKPGNDVGMLALRSKELQAGTALAAGSFGGVGVGLFALFAPKLMAKIALNHKTQGLLLNILNRSSKTPEGIKITENAIRTLLAAEGVDLAAEPLTSPN